jgi:hypothetical protein
MRLSRQWKERQFETDEKIRKEREHLGKYDSLLDHDLNKRIAGLPVCQGRRCACRSPSNLQSSPIQHSRQIPAFLWSQPPKPLSLLQIHKQCIQMRRMLVRGGQISRHRGLTRRVIFPSRRNQPLTVGMMRWLNSVLEELEKGCGCVVENLQVLNFTSPRLFRGRDGAAQPIDCRCRYPHLAAAQSLSEASGGTREFGII